jgi:hypothetical protein
MLKNNKIEVLSIKNIDLKAAVWYLLEKLIFFYDAIGGTDA